MRIAEVAALAGVSTRAVRHYHRTGVLPEPDRRANGYRDYDLGDLVRLLRVRWLHRSGVPLRDIARMGIGAEQLPGASRANEIASGPDGTTALTDLDALIQAVGSQIEELIERRRRLVDLRAQVAAGRPLDPRGAAVTEALSLLAEAAGPDLTPVLKREDLALQAAYLTGPVSVQVEEAVAAIYRRVATDPEALIALREVEHRMAALELADPHSGATRVEIEAVAHELVRVLPQEVWELADWGGRGADGASTADPAWSGGPTWTAGTGTGGDEATQEVPESGADQAERVGPLDWLAALVPSENGQAVIRRVWQLGPR